MKTKTINCIEYIVYKEGMSINDSSKSFYFEDDLDYNGNVTCLHFYAMKDVIIRGDQDVRGYQYVHGNQYVYGDQEVRGDQYVGGDQYVDGYQYVHGNQYVYGDQEVRGDQYVGGDQYICIDQHVRGNQDIRGYQEVRGNQYVHGDQHVRYIYLHLYCKYSIRIDRESDVIKIGCTEKSQSEWEKFFANKETINLSSDDRNYKKLETAFKAAVLMREHLKLMNDAPTKSDETVK